MYEQEIIKKSNPGFPKALDLFHTEITHSSTAPKVCPGLTNFQGLPKIRKSQRGGQVKSHLFDVFNLVSISFFVQQLKKPGRNHVSLRIHRFSNPCNCEVKFVEPVQTQNVGNPSKLVQPPSYVYHICFKFYRTCEFHLKQIG